MQWFFAWMESVFELNEWSSLARCIKYVAVWSAMNDLRTALNKSESD